MQKKPDGETRNPTDIWSGMGFSKSMPESVIRERMQRIQGVLAYCEPTMETTYEVRREFMFPLNKLHDICMMRDKGTVNT